MYKNNNIKFAKKFTDSSLAKGSLYGALSGVLGGGIGTILYNLIKKNKWYKNVLPAVLIGGATGGIAGLGGGSIYERMKKRMANKKVDDLLAKVKKKIHISKAKEKIIRQVADQAVKTDGKELLTPEVRDRLISKLQKFNDNGGGLLTGRKLSEKINQLGKQENISKDDVKNIIESFKGDNDVALNPEKKSEIVKYLNNILNIAESSGGDIETSKVPKVRIRDVHLGTVAGNVISNVENAMSNVKNTISEMFDMSDLIKKERPDLVRKMTEEEIFRTNRYNFTSEERELKDLINNPPRNHEDYKSKYTGMPKEELKDKLKYIIKEHKKFRKLKYEAKEIYDALNPLYGRQEVRWLPDPEGSALEFMGGLSGRDNEEFLQAADALSHYTNEADTLYSEATVMKNILRDKNEPSSKDKIRAELLGF